MIPNEILNQVIAEGHESAKMHMVYSRYSTNTYEEVMEAVKDPEKLAFSYDLCFRFSGNARCSMTPFGTISQEVENKDFVCLIPVVVIKTYKGNEIKFFDKTEPPTFLTSGAKTVVVVK